ncbi:hypothetical protein K1719_002291 [Acacia pycnantha]|nr:hypothetical protein K1719_002291 [Acacia pycnantha]
MAVVAIFCWNIWKGGCAWVFNGEVLDIGRVISVSQSFEAKNKNIIPESTKGGRMDSALQWEAPAPGFVKINIDGAFIRALDTAGIDVICRNSSGDMVGGLAETDCEDLFLLMIGRKKKASDWQCLDLVQELLDLKNEASGQSDLSLLFCSCHEKDAQKRYAQRTEDPLRVYVVSESPCASLPLRRLTVTLSASDLWPSPILLLRLRCSSSFLPKTPASTLRLSFFTTVSHLRNLFSPFGKITEACLVKDPKTQRPEGFGFVSYESEIEAERAINAMNARKVKNDCLILGNGLDVLGSWLTISRGRSHGKVPNENIENALITYQGQSKMEPSMTWYYQ